MIRRVASSTLALDRSPLFTTSSDARAFPIELLLKRCIGFLRPALVSDKFEFRAQVINGKVVGTLIDMPRWNVIFIETAEATNHEVVKICSSMLLEHFR